MCGIVGYVGYRVAYPYILQGLRRLEHSQYDSAGISVLNSHLHIFGNKYGVSDLAARLDLVCPNGNTGVGHIRWSKPGTPSEVNPDQHSSGAGRLAIVYNGTIENGLELKKDQRFELTCKSDCDAEVLVHLIAKVQLELNCCIEDAIRLGLQRVVGEFVVLILDERHPGTIYAACKGYPLLIGIGYGEHYLASDSSAFLEYTDRWNAVGDDEIVIVTASEFAQRSLLGKASRMREST